MEENGVVTILSHQSVDQAVHNLEMILQSKGVKLFCIIDHSGEAERAGLKMRSTKLLIFGNPKAGTPLMIAVPTIALDLPLKILISEGADGKTWITYNAPGFLASRHNVPPELAPALAAVEALARSAAE